MTRNRTHRKHAMEEPVFDARRLSKAIAASGHTNRDLSIALNVTDATLYKWKSTKHRQVPPAAKLIMIGQLLSIDDPLGEFFSAA